MERKEQLSGSDSELPVELVHEILARLPVRSLLRFRIVCKSWNSLISSPDFAYLHLACYHSADDDTTTILTYSGWPSKRWERRSSKTFGTLMERCGGNLCANGLMSAANHYPCANSVNGLVLLCSDIGRAERKSTELMLWNPIIGKSRQLPPLKGTHVSLGLGFTESDNDYKVVTISGYPRASVHLCTLSIGTWRSIDSYEEIMINATYSRCVQVEGALFWVITNHHPWSQRMVSFDVKHEIFDYITLPFDDSTRARYPVAYRNCVGLLDVGKENLCSLWVMEKDKEPGTWSKQYTVALPGSGFRNIICFKKNGHFIYATKGGVVELCDIETQRVKHLVNGCPFYFRWGDVLLTCYLYKESLVLL